MLDGRFEIHEGKFLHSTIQNQIDNLSHRARGQPEDFAAEQAVSHMNRAFMENAAIHFSSLSFNSRGWISIGGDYGLDSDALDFGGTLKLQRPFPRWSRGWKSKLLNGLTDSSK